MPVYKLHKFTSDHGVSLLDTTWNLKKGINKFNLSWVSDPNKDPQDCDKSDNLLPEPRWGETLPSLEFQSLEELEIFLQVIGIILGENLQHYYYNTIGSFLKFYDDYKKQGRPPLKEFFLNYQACIMMESLSCVGLSYALIEYIVNSDLSLFYPQLKSCLFLASCEECILDVDNYCSSSPPNKSVAVKEHVLAACKIYVEGREGVIILDPGYHVGIPIVAMKDGLYPHKGWFVQSETPKSKKEYCYQLKGDYVHWTVRETRNGKEETWCNLIYIKKKFLSYISVSEKRNLVFNFRTLVARDEKQPVGGFYCNLEGDEKFTLFFKDYLGKRIEIKIPFGYFKGSRNNNEYESAIRKCAVQIKTNSALLVGMMTQLVEAYYDKEFMLPINEINREIDEED